MNRIPVIATAIVALNLLINTAHGIAHIRSHVPLETWQLIFVLTTVWVLPLLAMVLYWTALRRSGALLLAGSMFAAMLFGIYFHFLADTADHVSYRPADFEGTVSVVTAWLLIPAALLGVGFGWWS